MEKKKVVEEFKLVNIRDTKKISEYLQNDLWIQSPLIPYYREAYICFSLDKAYSFEELKFLFQFGRESERIGAISLIAEQFPEHLCEYIHAEKCDFSAQQIQFIIERVVPDYLPLMIPKDKIMEYTFDGIYAEDIWVKMLSNFRGE